jgi:hypothetical protein
MSRFRIYYRNAGRVFCAAWRHLTLAVIAGTLSTATCAAELTVVGDISDTNARLDTLFGAHRPYEQFLARLQKATKASNWSEVAKMIAYPISFSMAGRKTKVASENAFLHLVTRIMTPKVVAAIPAQSYSGIFANGEGVMIGDGEVWFSGVCSDAACANPPIKITAIRP